MVKDLPGSQETLGFPGFDPWVGKREEEMATHSSLPACRIPRIEEPGRATVHGDSKSQTRFRHDFVDSNDNHHHQHFKN